MLRAALLLSLVAASAIAEPPAASPPPRVIVETTHGRIVFELDTARAPLSSENFLRYVRDGFYDGTIFHRVIPGFVVQGGGFDAGLKPREGRPTIPNESGNGLSNRRGSIGLAREESPHSGSSQFYVNLADNAGLDPLPTRWGYAVFGKVVEGMEVIDRIAYLPTATVENFAPDVPVARPAIVRARQDDGAPAPAVPPTPPEPPSGGR